MPAGSAAAETLHLLGGLSRPPSPSFVRQSPPIREQQQQEQQLTIFYSGIVRAYENVPAAKAHAIMLLLADGDGRGRISDEYQSRSSTTHDTKPTTYTGGVSSRPASPPTLVFSSATHEINRKQKQLALRLQRSQAELPFARKASLARFLEKRKDRVQAIKQAGSSSQEEEVSHGHQCKKIKLSTTGSVSVSPPKVVHAAPTPFLF